MIGQQGNEDEDEDEEEEEEWLVFRRHLDDANSSCESFVEVAFRLKDDGKSKKQIIQKTESSPLVVYFPTKLETRFGFLVQGSYDTNASRSDIEDNEWNRKLIEETTFLVTEQVLPTLKEMGLLTVSLLETLPIRMDDFPEDGMFYPIVEAVRDALMDKKLLPADDGTFVTARNVKLASAEWLRTLLRDEQLKQLFKTENPLKCISGEITERTKHDLWKYIREELKVEEITPDSFARKIEGSFLEKQTDDWMTAFYTQLVGQKALWKQGGGYWNPAGPLREKPFIRLQDGSHVKPFRDNDSPNAYLTVGADTETSLPIIKVKLSQDKKTYQFLNELGIPELDLVAEVIEQILPKYTTDPAIIFIDEHKRDFITIEGAYATDSHEKKWRLRERLRATQFILVENPSAGGTIYRRPNEVYFGSDELRMYFSGNDSFACVNPEYAQSAMTLFKELGVSESVRVQRIESNRQGYVSMKDFHGWHERAINGFDPDIFVDGLECAIANPTPERSVFIWNNIAVPNAACIRGVVETSTRQTYENSTTEDRTSEFGRLLIDTAWLPGSDERMCKPSELTLGDLPESFVRDERVADQLGMKKDVLAKLAKEAGVPAEDIELLRQHPEEFKQWKAAISAQKPAFLERDSSNPERRREKLAEQLGDAPNKEYEQRDRSVRTTRGAVDPILWLRNKYKNEAGQMICQICKEEMPFKKRDGEYYFEAVEALSRDHFTKEHEAQFLALCPLCAAMYNEFVKHDEGAMESLKNALMDSEDIEVSLQLGELDTSVRFVESHFQDIRTIIEAHE